MVQAVAYAENFRGEGQVSSQSCDATNQFWGKCRRHDHSRGSGGNPPGKFCKIAPTYTKLHLHIQNCTYIYKITPTYTKLHLHIQNCTYIYKITPTYTKLHLHIQNCTYIYKIAPTYTKLHLKIQYCFYIFLFLGSEGRHGTVASPLRTLEGTGNIFIIHW